MWLKLISPWVLSFAILLEAAPPLHKLSRQESPIIEATLTSIAQFRSHTAKSYPHEANNNFFESQDRISFHSKAKPTEEDYLSLKPTTTSISNDETLPTALPQPLVNARHYRGPYSFETTKYPYTSVVKTYMTSATYDHTDDEGRTTKSYVLSATYTYAKPWTTTVYSAPCTTCDYTDPEGRFTLTRVRPWSNTRYPTWRDPDKERTAKYKPWKESRTDIPYITPRPHRTRKYIEASTIPSEGILTTATRYRVYESAPSRNHRKWRTTTISWKETFMKYPSTYTESEINIVKLRAVATPISNLQDTTINDNKLEYSREQEDTDTGSLIVREPARSATSSETDSRTFTKGQVVTTRHATTHVVVTYEYTDAKGHVTSKESTTKVRLYKYTRDITTTIESTYHWPQKTSVLHSKKTLVPEFSRDSSLLPTQTPRSMHTITPLPEGESPSLPNETCEFHLDPTDMASLIARHQAEKKKSTSNSKIVTTWRWQPPGATKTFWFTIPEPTSKQTGTKTSITTWYWTTWLEPVTLSTSHGWWTWRETPTFTTWWWTAPPSHPLTKHFAQQVEETAAYTLLKSSDGWSAKSIPTPSTLVTRLASVEEAQQYRPVPTHEVVSNAARDARRKSAVVNTSIRITAPAKIYTFTDVVRSITETIRFPETTLTFWSPNNLEKSVGGTSDVAIHPRGPSEVRKGKAFVKDTKATSKPSDRPGMTTETRHLGGYTSTLSWWPSSLDTTWVITRQPPPTEAPIAIKRNLAVDSGSPDSDQFYRDELHSHNPPLSVVVPVDQGFFPSSTPPYTWKAPITPPHLVNQPTSSVTQYYWGKQMTTALPKWLTFSIKAGWVVTWVVGKVPHRTAHFATTSTVYVPTTAWATRTIPVDSYYTPDIIVPLEVRANAKHAKEMPPCCVAELTRGGDPKMETTTMTYNVIHTSFHTRIPFSWTTTTWTFPRPTASTQKWPNKPRPTPPPGLKYWSTTPPSTKTKKKTSAWDPNTETDDGYLRARALKTGHKPHAMSRKHRTFRATNRPYVTTIESAFGWPSNAPAPSSTFIETIPYIPWNRARPTAGPWPPPKITAKTDARARYTTRTRTVPLERPDFVTSTWTTTITPQTRGITISGWSAYERPVEATSKRLTLLKTKVGTTVSATKTVKWLNITRIGRRPQYTRIRNWIHGRAPQSSNATTTPIGTKTFVTESVVTIQTSIPTPTTDTQKYPEELIDSENETYESIPLGRVPFVIVESLPAPTPTITGRRYPEYESDGYMEPASENYEDAPVTERAPPLKQNERLNDAHGTFEGEDSAQKNPDHTLEDFLGEHESAGWKEIRDWIEE